MARKTIKRNAPAAARAQFQPHDLLLAGIGAVSLGRKQVIDIYANGFEGIADLRERAQDAVDSAAKSLNGKVTALRKQAKAKAAPVQKQVIALATEIKAQAQSRLGPVLVKLGVAKAPTRRRAAPRKATATRARSRKAA